MSTKWRLDFSIMVVMGFLLYLSHGLIEAIRADSVQPSDIVGVVGMSVAVGVGLVVRRILPRL